MTSSKKTPQHYTIDASGQAIGRVATEAARLLMGKNRADYEPQDDAPYSVEIRNAAKVNLTGAKAEQKEFIHYSGYPGGLKRRQLKDVMDQNPAKAIQHAVRGMLPKNRLRQPRMNRLNIHND
jgi:large subunit ribosomal protein L13